MHPYASVGNAMVCLNGFQCSGELFPLLHPEDDGDPEVLAILQKKIKYHIMLITDIWTI